MRVWTQADARMIAEVAVKCADSAHRWKQRCIAAEKALRDSGSKPLVETNEDSARSRSDESRGAAKQQSPNPLPPHTGKGEILR